MRDDSLPVDVVVVGGGLAGLTAAAYLGRAGLSVRVLERAMELGGRGATRCEDGFFLNRGAHALYRAGEGTQVLGELGVAHHGHPVPGSGKALRGGVLHRLPTDTLSLFTTGLLSLRAKAAAARILQRTPRLSPRAFENHSVAQWLEGAPSEVRAMTEAFVRVTTYVNAPEEFSGATALVQLQRALAAGVLYVDGGWRTLVDGVATRAMSWGVRIAHGTRATGLTRDGAGYTVTTASGERIATRAVVLAVPPRDAASLLDGAGARLPSLAHVVECKVAALDLALNRIPRPEERFVLGIDRPLYLSVHSSVAKLAPSGKGVIHMMKYLTPRDDDPDADRRELEGLLDLAQPGWRREVVHAQYLPRMTAVERLDLAAEGGDRGRPEPAVPSLPGVALAGDWVQGGSWLADASFGSARAAAQAVAAYLAPAKAVA